MAKVSSKLKKGASRAWDAYDTGIGNAYDKVGSAARSVSNKVKGKTTGNLTARGGAVNRTGKAIHNIATSTTTNRGRSYNKASSGVGRAARSASSISSEYAKKKKSNR